MKRVRMVEVGTTLGGRCQNSSYSSLPRGRSKIKSHVTAPPVHWRVRGKVERERKREREREGGRERLLVIFCKICESHCRL